MKNEVDLSSLIELQTRLLNNAFWSFIEGWCFDLLHVLLQKDEGEKNQIDRDCYRPDVMLTVFQFMRPRLAEIQTSLRRAETFVFYLILKKTAADWRVLSAAWQRFLLNVPAKPDSKHISPDYSVVAMGIRFAIEGRRWRLFPQPMFLWICFFSATVIDLGVCKVSETPKFRYLQMSNDTPGNVPEGQLRYLCLVVPIGCSDAVDSISPLKIHSVPSLIWSGGDW